MSLLKRCTAFICFLFVLMGLRQFAIAQNTSNQGTDFWVAYAGHVDGGADQVYAGYLYPRSILTLFITSKVDAQVSINAGGKAYAGGVINVTANSAVPVYIDPKIYTNVYVGQSDGIAKNRGIHVTSTAPIVLYAHISNRARSAATLVLPTKALGNEYYAMAYNQGPSIPATPEFLGELRVSQFTVLGTADNTVIEITPKVSSSSGSRIAGQPFQITLDEGDVYQFQSATDVTGCQIKTVGSCKPIAVFSGSTKSGFCAEPGSVEGTGQDNLYQQLLPLNIWGKNYVTAPFYNALNGVADIIRIFVAKDNTTLTVNGSTTSANGVALSNPYPKGSIVTFTSSAPNIISANEPISVAQLQVSESCNPNNAADPNNPLFPGDPEMTILNPIEQTLTDITVYSAVSVDAAPTYITKHYINLIIKTADIPSLKIDGINIPATAFTAINSDYSYLIKDVTAASAISPTHRITADGGFLAIAYGYGHYESYAYLAGSDLKNLTQFVEVKNPTTSQAEAQGCAAQNYVLEVNLAYPTTELRWNLGDGQPEIVQTSPVFNRKIIQAGTELYVYQLTSGVNYTSTGIKNIVVKSFNPGASVCGDYDTINLSFQIYESPVSLFELSSATCINAPVTFTNKSTLGTGSIVKWIWDFKDGNIVERDNPNPVTHIFNAAGDFAPTLTVVADNGCTVLSDPVNLHINQNPVASFVYANLPCVANPIQFTDQSSSSEGAIVKWAWNFGDSQVSAISSPQHTYSGSGIFPVSFTVETDKGCVDTAAPQSIEIFPLPINDYLVPDICLDDPEANFTNLSKNMDGSITDLSYLWNFDDPYANLANPNTSAERTPGHRYTSEGAYEITLTVSTPQGCAVTLSKPFKVNGVNPVADFEIINSSNLCSADKVVFKNKSYVNGFGDITRLEWYFDFIDQPSLVYVDEEPLPDKIYEFTYPKFNTPLSKNYSVRLVAYSGGDCVSPERIKTLTLKAVPEVLYNALPSVCEEASPFQITQASEIYGFSGSARFEGLGVGTTGVFNPAVAGPGTHDIKYVFKALNGCSDSLSRPIIVYPTPQVNLDNDLIILAGDMVYLNSVVSGNSLSYRWTPSVGLSQDNVPNPVALPAADITYTLTVSTPYTCSAADDVFIRVLQMPEVPNTFTPNGDGKNDYWNIKHLDSYAEARVEVFNRYGQRVYFSQGYAAPWDGKLDGQELPLGTYYYIITPGSGRKAMSGSITIIK